MNKTFPRTAVSFVVVLLAYFGYPDFDNVYEMYNLEDDPEEIQDLSQADLTSFSRLKEEPLDHLEDANRPYQSN